MSNLIDTQNLPQKADAIVVFTGGTNRIEAAIKLLKDEYAPIMFISGVRPKTKIENFEIIKKYGSKYTECCIEVDEIARNTIENAIETSKWGQAKQVKRIILVTSHYHMNRALAELTFNWPQVQIQPYSVVIERLSVANWWKSLQGWKLFGHEFLKLSGAYLRHDFLRIKRNIVG